MPKYCNWQSLLKFSAQNGYWRKLPLQKQDLSFAESYRQDYNWYLRDLAYCWKTDLREQFKEQDKFDPDIVRNSIQRRYESHTNKPKAKENCKPRLASVAESLNQHRELSKSRPAKGHTKTE